MKPTDNGLVPVRSKQPAGNAPQKDRLAYVSANYPRTPWKETPLSMRSKQALVLHWKHSMTVRQIADYIGVSKGTYEQRRYCNEGKAFWESLQNFEKDDARIIPMLADEQATRALADLTTCKDTLMAMEQWEAAGKLNIKLLELAGWPKKSLVDFDVQNQNITINVVNAAQFDSSPPTESSYELLSGSD